MRACRWKRANRAAGQILGVRRVRRRYVGRSPPAPPTHVTGVRSWPQNLRNNGSHRERNAKVDVSDAACHQCHHR
ncbi:MAG: DUF1588 domain-containing protein [Mesorhizobium sp.]|nr:MAG: DUF1588 domain-containing protein [Mesorhizobium sp.]